jgi:hypothetical protein
VETRTEIFIEDLEKIRGGANSLVLKAIVDGNKAIIKQYGYERKHNSKLPRLKHTEFSQLLVDVDKLREILFNAQINVPDKICYFFIDDTSLYTEIRKINISNSDSTVRLVWIENYCGESLKEIIKNNNIDGKTLNSIVKQIENLITKMPEEIEIDVAPSNFTILDRKIYFVDFMPPKIVEYRNIQKYRDMFPSIAERIDSREFKRIKRYTTTEGRIERFNIYLKELLNN